MSPLPDDRKELALQQVNGATQPSGELGVDLPTYSAPQKKQEESPHATRCADIATPVRARGRIIPIAITCGLVLAAGGGYDIWREISPPPMQRQYPAPAAPMEQTVSVPRIPAAPAISATKNAPAAPADVSMKPPEIAETDILPADQHDTEALRIEHAHEGDAVDPILMAAWQAYRNGDFEISRQRYSEVLRKDAQNRNTPNRDALLGMAAIAMQQSQDAVASRYYGEVLVLDPRDPVANAGMSALETGDAAATESRLKFLLAQQSRQAGTAALHFVLGNLYAEQSRWGEARQAYFNACKLEQDNAQFAFNLAVSLDHLGQGKLAAQHYRRALQLDVPDNAGFNRAQTQQRINELATY